uniref:Uncharacterized protein n=1 Tax=Siphoviridae sp. ctXQ92 TaxID=2825543 RepID=A0A8S5PGL9_9CAUD|nr:MAG TPA: hypothetical protein [Siphoviridae sp. ctXQ92]
MPCGIYRIFVNFVSLGNLWKLCKFYDLCGLCMAIDLPLCLGNTAQFPPDGLSTAPAAAALRIMRYCLYN